MDPEPITTNDWLIRHDYYWTKKRLDPRTDVRPQDEQNIPNPEHLVETPINYVGGGELGGSFNFGSAEMCSVKLMEPALLKSLLFTTENVWGRSQDDPNELLVKEGGRAPNQLVITSKTCIKEESNRVSFVREHVSQQDEIELRIFSNENELNGITNALGYPV